MTSVHFITQGCSANQADSEQMMGLLKVAKFELTENLEEADILVYNTCTVKNSPESGFFNHLQEIKREHPYKIMVLTGCIAQADKDKLKEYPLVGTNQIHNIVLVVEEALNNNVVKMLETGEMPPLNLPKVRLNPIIEIIPLNWGCLSTCTFSKTKSARENLKSYPLKEIVEAASKAVKEGVKEIRLTSQDTFGYGFDMGTNIVELLNNIIKIPGQFKIRIGMGSPVHLIKIADQFIPLLNHEKVFSFIHLPAQSGSDEVLRKMHRGNTDQEFRMLVKKLRNAVPNLNLITDIIVGFPGETDDDFWKTLNLAREISPDSINISRYWGRTKNPAAKMEQVSVEIIQRRSGTLTDIFHNISKLQNEKWIGWEGPALIYEPGKLAGQWIGINNSYKQVLVNGDFKLGDLVRVRVIKAGTFDLIGEVVI